LSKKAAATWLTIPDEVKGMAIGLITNSDLSLPENFVPIILLAEELRFS
jgi:hypothetical protein